MKKDRIPLLRIRWVWESIPCMQYDFTNLMKV